MPLRSAAAPPKFSATAQYVLSIIGICQSFIIVFCSLSVSAVIMTSGVPRLIQRTVKGRRFYAYVPAFLYEIRVRKAPFLLCASPVELKAVPSVYT